MITAHDFQLVFCDDIRREDSGKHILVGVYGSNIILNSFPSTFFMSVWFKMLRPPKGDHKFLFTITGTGKEPSKSTAEGAFFVEDASQPLILTFVGMPIEFHTSGEVKASVTIDDDKEIDLGGIPVDELQRTA